MTRTPHWSHQLVPVGCFSLKRRGNCPTSCVQREPTKPGGPSSAKADTPNAEDFVSNRR
jgi:hypothetical protein